MLFSARLSCSLSFATNIIDTHNKGIISMVLCYLSYLIFMATDYPWASPDECRENLDSEKSVDKSGVTPSARDNTGIWVLFCGIKNFPLPTSPSNILITSFSCSKIFMKPLWPAMRSFYNLSVSWFCAIRVRSFLPLLIRVAQSNLTFHSPSAKWADNRDWPLKKSIIINHKSACGQYTQIFVIYYCHSLFTQILSHLSRFFLGKKPQRSLFAPSTSLPHSQWVSQNHKFRWIKGLDKW